jgi:hypothetical protein
VEGRAFLERNGYKIGLFGLTAPKNYGAADSIYPTDAATKALAEFRDASLILRRTVFRGKALKVPLGELAESNDKVGSALDRATRKAGNKVATASDANFLYIWNDTL